MKQQILCSLGGGGVASRVVRPNVFWGAGPLHHLVAGSAPCLPPHLGV